MHEKSRDTLFIGVIAQRSRSAELKVVVKGFVFVIHANDKVRGLWDKASIVPGVFKEPERAKEFLEVGEGETLSAKDLVIHGQEMVFRKSSSRVTNGGDLLAKDGFDGESTRGVDHNGDGSKEPIIFLD